MTGECSRCGACCRIVPLQTKAMSPEYLNYLRTRGLQEAQGFILIPHDCQHLYRANIYAVDLFPEDHKNKKFSCDIHESPDRPKVCKIFHGQKRSARAVFYVPPGCTMKEQ